MKKLVLIEGVEGNRQSETTPIMGLVKFLNEDCGDVTVLYFYPSNVLTLKDDMYNHLSTGEYSHIIFFMLPSYFLDEKDLVKLGEDAVLVSYQADIPEYFDIYYSVISQYFDVILVDEYLEKYRYNIFQYNAIHFNHGFAVSKYVSCSEEERYIDVSFIGRMDRKGRQEQIERLKNMGIKVFIAGAGTDIGFISYDEMINIYSRSKIVLNFTGISTRVPYFIKNIEINSNIHQLKGRLYEAMLCGAMVLSEKCASASHILSIGKHIDEFASPDEMVDKINYYLTKTDERVKISNFANSYAIKNLNYKSVKNNLYSIIDVNKTGQNRRSFYSSVDYKRYMVRVCFLEAIKSRCLNTVFMQIARVFYYRNIYVIYDLLATVFISMLRAIKYLLKK